MYVQNTLTQERLGPLGQGNDTISVAMSGAEENHHMAGLGFHGRMGLIGG